MRRSVKVLGFAVVAAALSTPAPAIDYTFAGKLFIAKSGGKLVKVLSKGAFQMPAPGNEPTAVGATLHVFDVGGAGGDNTYNLPAAGWTGDPIKGYKYKGAGTATDPCKVVLIKPKILKAVCKDRGAGGVTLSPPFAGTAAAVIGAGGDRYCGEFGGATIKNDAKLIKRKDAPAPAFCTGAAPTATSTPTGTPTGTVTPTGTATPTSTFTPPPVPIGAHLCTLGAGSQVQIFSGVLTQTLSASGSVEFNCGAPGANGKAACSCEVQPPGFSPLNIAGLFWACVKPASTPCPDGEVDCNGGNSLGLDVDGNRNIGACTGQASCAGTCATFCGGAGNVFASNCEGFCTDGAQMACSDDDQCSMAGQGSCDGPDGTGFGNICDCTCVDLAVPPPAPAGGLSCQLAFNLTVEPNPGNGMACDGADVQINVGDTCAPLTTESVSGIIHNANNGGGTLPTGGPFTGNGTEIPCATLASSSTAGLSAKGAAAFYASTIGDILAGLTLTCQ